MNLIVTHKGQSITITADEIWEALQPVAVECHVIGGPGCVDLPAVRPMKP
jgi:hypothetical protein